MENKKRRGKKRNNEHTLYNFKRACINCEQHKHCPMEPPPGLKRYTEWCQHFVPDYKKIARKSGIYARGINTSPKNVNYRLVNNLEKLQTLNKQLDKMFDISEE